MWNKTECFQFMGEVNILKLSVPCRYGYFIVVNPYHVLFFFQTLMTVIQTRV